MNLIFLNTSKNDFPNNAKKMEKILFFSNNLKLKYEIVVIYF